MRGPCIEQVRTDAGWHGRIKGSNGETVWTTEVYTNAKHVEDAVDLALQLASDFSYPLIRIRDERSRS